MDAIGTELNTREATRSLPSARRARARVRGRRRSFPKRGWSDKQAESGGSGTKKEKTGKSRQRVNCCLDTKTSFTVRLQHCNATDASGLIQETTSIARSPYIAFERATASEPFWKTRAWTTDLFVSTEGKCCDTHIAAVCESVKGERRKRYKYEYLVLINEYLGKLVSECPKVPKLFYSLLNFSN